MANKRQKFHINSKFYLVIVVVFVGLCGFLGGLKYFENKNSDDQLVGQTQEKAICGYGECLFNNPWDNVVVGYARMIGYYTTFTTTVGYGSDEKIVCDAFIPIRSYGSKKLYDSLAKFAENNSAARYNSDKDLMVNINLDNLTLEQRQMVKSSNFDNLVELSVLKPTPSYRDSSACESSVILLSAKKFPESSQ